MSERETFDHAERIATRERGEATIDAREEVTPVRRLAIIRECIAVLAEADLLHRDLDDYMLAMEWAAEKLGVPFLELYFMAEASIEHPDVDREHLAEWLDWCRQHAPERLATKGGA